MPRLAVAALLTLFTATAARADIAPPRIIVSPTPTKIKRDPGPRWVVGLVTEVGDARCLAGGEVEWVHKRAEVGFTPLTPAAGVDPTRWFGQLVVVEGAVATRGPVKFRPVKHEGPCLEAQMRSDWVAAPGGFRMLRRGMGEAVKAFTANKITPWSGLTVRVQGSNLEIALTNTFDEPLTPAVIRVHYEGCHGKPGTSERSSGTPALGPGETMRATLPIHLRETDRPDGREAFTAWSVQIEARSPSVAFDLDWPLSRAGADVTCPEAHK